MRKDWPFFPLTPTRHKEPAKYDPTTLVQISDSCALYFGKQDKVGWRFVVLCDGSYSQVGETYATKDELLADMPRYAESWGLA